MADINVTVYSTPYGIPGPAYAFDGGSPSSVYRFGPIFDCGGVI